jgi:hypothetical protein
MSIFDPEMIARVKAMTDDMPDWKKGQPMPEPEPPKTYTDAEKIDMLVKALKMWMDAFNSRMMSSESKSAQRIRVRMWAQAQAAIQAAEGK